MTAPCREDLQIDTHWFSLSIRRLKFHLIFVHSWQIEKSHFDFFQTTPYIEDLIQIWLEKFQIDF